MIKNYIDYLRAFFRNWKEIKENINRIIAQDLIHRKVVLHTDDLNETFARMKYIMDYKPTYKQKQLPLPNSGELIDVTKMFKNQN